MFSFEKVGGSISPNGYAYIYFMILWVYSRAVRFKTRHTYMDHRRDYVTSLSASGKLTTLTQKLGISLSFRPQNIMVHGAMSRYNGVPRPQPRYMHTVPTYKMWGDRSYERGDGEGGVDHLRVGYVKQTSFVSNE